MQKNRGQILNTTNLVLGGVMFVASWAGSYIFNSPAKATAAIQIVDTKINSTNERVSSLEADNKTMKEWLTRIEGKLDKVISR